MKTPRTYRKFQYKQEKIKDLEGNEDNLQLDILDDDSDIEIEE